MEDTMAKSRPLVTSMQDGKESQYIKSFSLNITFYRMPPSHIEWMMRENV